MKVIFLDFDGVLNSSRFINDSGVRSRDYWKHPEAWIDRAAVERLNQIVSRTGAIVVVSSSWRIYHTARALEYMLVDAGFRGRIRGVTQSLFPERRHHEIQDWLEDNEDLVDGYVILDDDWEAGVGMAPNFVHTDADVGLTDADVEKAVKILSKNDEEAA